MRFFSRTGGEPVDPATPRSRRTRLWARAIFVILVGLWLVFQLSHIGWAEVWAERPRTPWFYIIWVGLYFQLPLAESLVYRMIFRLPFREVAPPLLRKRALNQDVVSYSGEFYFFLWLRDRLAAPGRRILGAMKDNAIASVLASWTSTTLFVGGFLLAGLIAPLSFVTERQLLVIAIGAAIVMSLILIGVRFRRRLLTLPTRTAAACYGLHLGRLVLIAGLLQILQWWIVVPSAPLSVWATIFVVLALVNRLPLIPARDLVGISAVLGLSSYIAAPASVIAALLLTRSALDKLANGAFFLAGHFLETRPDRLDEETVTTASSAPRSRPATPVAEEA